VKLAHYASEVDNAGSADPPGGIKHAIEYRRPNHEVAWVNIIANRWGRGLPANLASDKRASGKLGG
jgi:hypothetical protein